MASAEAGPLAGASDNADIRSLFGNIHLVPVDVLMNISKGPLKVFVQNCEDKQQARSVWESLFLTLSTRSVSKEQTRAACNAIIVFLENANATRAEATWDFAFSNKTWMAVFTTILAKFEDAALKAIKQLLGTLAKILKCHPDSSEAQLIRAEIINVVMPSVILGDPRSQLKSSLVALERLIQGDGMSVKTLMSLTYDWLVAHYERWQPLFEGHCRSLFIETSQFTQTNSVYDITNERARNAVPMIFNLALLVYAKSQGFTQAIGTLIALLHTKVGNCEDSNLESCFPLMSWVVPTRYIMLQDMDSIEYMSRSILRPILECDINGFHAFTKTLPLDMVLSGNMKSQGSVDELILLFSTLQIGKKTGFVHEDYVKESKSTAIKKENILILDSKIIGTFLLHNEQGICLSTLSLLITAPSSAKPLSKSALDAILAGLPSLHAVSNSQIRQEIGSLMRKMMTRLRGPGMQKNFMDNEGKDAKKFMEDFVSFLEGELISTASYQRHISALKSMTLVLNSGVDPNARHVSLEDQSLWRYKVDILRPSLFRLLVDLLLDPFDEIRATALSLLSLFPSDIFTNSTAQLESDGLNVSERLTSALTKAEALASSTSRADYADAVARIYKAIFSAAKSGGSLETSQKWFETKCGVVNEVLQRLEEKVYQQGGLFKSSIRDAPLHGHLCALKYIVGTPNFYSCIASQEGDKDVSWRKVHDRIMATCHRIWDGVKPVLCIDSPEGHTDDTLDDMELGPKDLLSYSWRALRESSLLLNEILANKTYAPKDSKTSLVLDDYTTIGALSFTQLSELRHRGAFSAVSQTFVACCERCAEHENTEISNLPDMWYQDSKKIIEDQASKLTRRSAGLPAIVTGITIAKCNDPLFEKIIHELQEISSQPAVQAASYNELSLPQVHAMNCLKDILATTRLGDKTEGFIMPILRLSADSLSSPIWAIRNCGLMLFHALMIKMCKRVQGTGFGFSGTSGTESSMTIEFQKYPGLTELLSKLLTSADESRDSKDGSAASETEKVFPALEIITEKVPSLTDNDDAVLRDLILHHVKSSIWAVRDQAARVHASLMRSTEIVQSVESLLDYELSTLSQKHLHGRLLCIRYALRRVWYSGYWRDHFDSLLAIISDTFSRFTPFLRSPYCQAALIDVLTDGLESSLKSSRGVDIQGFAHGLFDSYELGLLMANLVSHVGYRRNEVRAESLLRRSLTWSIILKNSLHNINDSPAGLIGPFFDLSTADSDAAGWVLERIRDVFPGYKGQKDFLSLYLLILLQDQEETVKAKAALNLAETLEDALEKGLSVDFLDKWARVSDYLSVQSQDQVWSRELTENVLRLQGAMLALKYADESFDTESQEPSLGLRRWAVGLRSALSEETVFSSRLAAIHSLKTFSRIIRKPDQPPSTDAAFLELYLILYDMLNDDDDELRDFSAPIASWILSYSSVFPDKTVALGSIPASESLAEFISSNYNKQKSLFRHIIKRMMNKSAVPQRGKLQFTSFETLFNDYRKESTVLFEEEKQNLFIDDVREIDIWSSALIRLEKSAFDEDIIDNLFAWASEGLACLERCLISGDQDGDLGWTAKPEIYSLGILLFSITSFLIATNPKTSGKTDEGSSASLSEALTALYTKGQSMALHPHWLSRIRPSRPSK
ncbi:HEAT repeat protein [Talaromyces proteolyticus]|uniref:HEAT repeat protein n=1 Tax=Talaromyces proteolyticus TaxID=1131652 RepID=A0AAD4PT52_9EURO|nr:HEAT repeat protein [Talaromyces proteolyticus]KAH8690204.1 HEAT repeat protein [Talaromyces proteolyticus]